MKVVFTGPAFDGTGRSIVRADLMQACAVKGITVQPAVKADTQTVVASRLDTQKAMSAAKLGKEVITYPQFITQYLGEVEIKTGGRPNKYTDAVIPDLLVPDFTVGYEVMDACG